MAIITTGDKQLKNRSGQGRKPEPGFHATIKVRFESADDLAYVLKHMPDLLVRGKTLKSNAVLKSYLTTAPRIEANT